jgi:hypothetical protein
MAIREWTRPIGSVPGLPWLAGIAAIALRGAAEWNSGGVCPLVAGRFASPNRAGPISAIRHGIAKQWGLALPPSLERTHPVA